MLVFQAYLEGLMLTVLTGCPSTWVHVVAPPGWLEVGGGGPVWGPSLWWRQAFRLVRWHYLLVRSGAGARLATELASQRPGPGSWSHSVSQYPARSITFLLGVEPICLSPTLLRTMFHALKKTNISPPLLAEQMPVILRLIKKKQMQ